MRRRRGGRLEESNVDMTPMLDIVFIMLIFFIVTATFLDERGIDVTKPQQNNDSQQDDSTPSILVEVDERGFVTVGLDTVSPDAVASRVSRELARFPGASVIYRTHPDSIAELGVEVYDQILQAGAPVTWEKIPDA